jgi:predicted phage tail protein
MGVKIQAAAGTQGAARVLGTALSGRLLREMATRRERQLPWAVGALCLVQFMDVLGVTVVVTSLPSMLASLHASQSYSSLIATGYAMFFGGLLMLGARLGDRYGHLSSAAS